MYQPTNHIPPSIHPSIIYQPPIHLSTIYQPNASVYQSTIYLHYTNPSNVPTTYLHPSIHPSIQPSIRSSSTNHQTFYLPSTVLIQSICLPIYQPFIYIIPTIYIHYTNPYDVPTTYLHSSIHPSIHHLPTTKPSIYQLLTQSICLPIYHLSTLYQPI